MNSDSVDGLNVSELITSSNPSNDQMVTSESMPTQADYCRATPLLVPEASNFHGHNLLLLHTAFCKARQPGRVTASQETVSGNRAVLSLFCQMRHGARQAKPQIMETESTAPVLHIVDTQSLRGSLEVTVKVATLLLRCPLILDQHRLPILTLQTVRTAGTTSTGHFEPTLFHVFFVFFKDKCFFLFVFYVFRLAEFECDVGFEITG